MYLLAITAADHTIHLSSSYFVPDELTSKALVAALRRGVKVQIITPGGDIDAEVVRTASRARWGDLLAAGAELFEYQPTMFHCKVMIVDALLVSVGSTNFDNRSVSLNDEANLNVFDPAFANRQIAVFGQDLAHSRRITLEEWTHRPYTEKLLEDRRFNHTTPCIGGWVSGGSAADVGRQPAGGVLAMARSMVRRREGHGNREGWRRLAQLTPRRARTARSTAWLPGDARRRHDEPRNANSCMR